MSIAMGADNNGFVLKELVKSHLVSLGHEVVDYGTDNRGPVDNTDVAPTVPRIYEIDAEYRSPRRPEQSAQRQK